MKHSDQPTKIMVNMQISIFNIPPCQDVIVIGKKAAIGKHATMRMLETVAPGLFVLIETEHPVIEALVAKKGFIKLMGRERLLGLIIEEVESIMEDSVILNISLDAKLLKRGVIEIADDGTP